MTQERFSEVKEQYLESIKKIMEMTGNMVPHITVFGAHKSEFIEGTNEPKQAVVNIMIPSELMRSGETKELFIRDVFPKVAVKIKEMMVPDCIGWASEVWIREPEKGQETEDMDKIPISGEAVFATIDDGTNTSSTFFMINRKGKKVNEQGELVDDIELTVDDKKSQSAPSSQSTGRFANLFQKLLEA